MKEKIIGGIAERLAPRFGLTPTAVALALTTTFSIAATVHQRVTRFDKGYETAIEQLRDGSMELDGKLVEIMADADREALKSMKAAENARNEFNSSQAEHITSLEQILDTFARNRQNQERNNAPKTIWGDTPLPNHARLRFDTIARERQTSDNRRTDRTVDDRPVLAGAVNTYASPDE